MAKKINEHFFDKESKATYYVLGAFYANYTSKGVCGIKFSSAHKDLVEIIKEQLESEHAIISDPRKTSSHRFEVYNVPYLHPKLEKLGLDAPKSERKFPKYIGKEYISHFVRGFFDAKAYVYITGKLTRTRMEFNREFLVGLNKTLINKAGVKRKEPTKDIIWYGHENSLKIYDFIYRDWDFIEESGLYLKSKKELFRTDYNIYDHIHLNKVKAQEKVEKIKELLLKGEKPPEFFKKFYSHTGSLHRNFKRQTKQTIKKFLKKNK